MANFGIRFSFQSTNGIRLHCAESGLADAPLVLLLHGFPEFWFGWRLQLPALADAGVHAVAPDMRGYNLSDRPPRVEDYKIDQLVADVVGLIQNFSPGRPAALVGHDWGGIIAWYVAMRHPELLSRLVILNAPHPAAYQREIARSPWGSSQWWRSWYVLSFQLPSLPEAAIRFNDYYQARKFFALGPARGSQNVKADVERYIDAISRPRALSGMINYYRAALRYQARILKRDIRRIETPTLLVWGDRDVYLVRSLTEGVDEWVSNLTVRHLDATHWVQHDAPDAVNSALKQFLISSFATSRDSSC